MPNSYGIKFLHVKCIEFERNKRDIRCTYQYAGIKKVINEEEAEFLTNFPLMHYKTYYLILGKFDQNNKWRIEIDTDQVIGLFEKKDQANFASQYLNKIISPTNHDMIKIHQNNNFKGILNINQSFLNHNNKLCILKDNEEELKVIKKIRIEEIFLSKP